MIHLNGRLTADADAGISCADRGLTLADGLFETICVRAGLPLRLDRHFARLRRGAEILGIAIPYADETLKSFVRELLDANGVADGVLRLTVTRGPANRGLWPVKGATPSVILTADPIAFGEKPPARAWVVDGARRNHKSPLARVKSLNYGDSLLAAREAAMRGATVAILRNTDGGLAETATGSLFAVYRDCLLTPPVEDGALPGIMRACVIERFGAHQESLGVEDLFLATELFQANALGIQPIDQLNGKVLETAAPGPVTRAVVETLPP